MKKKTGILGILIAIVIIGIGYAAITAVPLVINGSGTISPDQNNFDVLYTACSNTAKTPNDLTATCSASDTTTATFSVSGMTKAGDTATFTFTITNNSADLKADLTKAVTYLTNNNTEYFEVTETTFANTTLNPGATTTQVVTVRAIKTPVGTSDISGDFTLELSAAPNNQSS